MSRSHFRGSIVQKPAPYGVPDITPPTFAGITGATPNTDGSITVNFSAASGPKTPIDYHVFIALGSVNAATLFQPNNVTLHVPSGKNSGRVFMLPDQTTFLVKGQVYTLGIRANDAYGFMDSNNVIQVVTAIASGNFPAIFQSLIDQLNSLNGAYDALNVVHGGLNTTQGSNNTTHATNNTTQNNLNTAHNNLNGVLSNTQEKLDDAANLVAVSVL